MDPFCYLFFVFVMLPCLFIACLERADLLALLSHVFFWFCHLSMWCPESGVVLDCIDS